MGTNKVSTNKSPFEGESEERRYARLRALAIAKGYNLKGVGATPEEQVRLSRKPHSKTLLLTKANRHRIHAFLMGEDDGKD